MRSYYLIYVELRRAEDDRPRLPQFIVFTVSKKTLNLTDYPTFSVPRFTHGSSNLHLSRIQTSITSLFQIHLKFGKKMRSCSYREDFTARVSEI